MKVWRCGSDSKLRRASELAMPVHRGDRPSHPRFRLSDGRRQDTFARISCIFCILRVSATPIYVYHLTHLVSVLPSSYGRYCPYGTQVLDLRFRSPSATRRALAVTTHAQDRTPRFQMKERRTYYAQGYTLMTCVSSHSRGTLRSPLS